MSIKISLIGAGSATFSLGLIQNLCQTPNLAGSRVSFMDVDEDRLATCQRLCSRYAEETNAKLTLEATLDRRESLKGADFVVNTALPGAHSRMVEGMEIGRRYGYRFNGSYHVMYDEAFWINYEQLRFFDSLTEDMLELCPDAWHLMLANPVFAGTTHLQRKYPRSKMTGMCHGFMGARSVAKLLGLEREHVTFEIPGVNHFVWMTYFLHKGRSAWPILDRWIETESQKWWASREYPGGSSLSPKAVALYKIFGVLPIGDTAHWTGASWPYWCHSDEAVEKSYGEVDAWKFWKDFQINSDKHARNLQAVSEDESKKVSEALPGLSSETMTEIIESIACDMPRVFQGNNILNTGQFIPGISQDVAVEIPTLVSQRGVQGIRTNGLPRPIIAQILSDRVGPMEMELAAYNEGSRDLLLQLILMDRNTTSRKQAENLLADILALPYHKDMREHYT
jgi:alpha-galactosidase